MAVMSNNICLLVTQDPLDQAIFARALRDVSPGTVCCIAENGLEAVKIMTEEKVIPDFIFVELNMPIMDGIEFLRKVKTIRPLGKIPVIVHSGIPEPDKLPSIKEAGASAIYFKEYNYSGVCNVLYLYFLSQLSPLHLN
jgi:CheY-like chemotaxis protein